MSIRNADPVHAPYLRGPGGEGAGHGRRSDPEALRELKAKGAKLGNRTNLADASRAGAAVNRGEANAFAANVLPIIPGIAASGHRRRP